MGQKNVSIFMPSKDEIAVDINNGEILISIRRNYLMFKHENILIEEPLLLDQWLYFINAITNKVRQKCDNIQDKITSGFNEIMK